MNLQNFDSNLILNYFPSVQQIVQIQVPVGKFPTVTELKPMTRSCSKYERTVYNCIVGRHLYNCVIELNPYFYSHFIEHYSNTNTILRIPCFLRKYNTFFKWLVLMWLYRLSIWVVTVIPFVDRNLSRIFTLASYDRFTSLSEAFITFLTDFIYLENL